MVDASKTYCQKFNTADICKGSNVVICGKRLQGKSTLLASILQNRGHDRYIIFTSRYAASSYRKYFPFAKVIDRYDRKMLAKIVDEQERNPDVEYLVAFDDVSAMLKDGTPVFKDNQVKDLIRYGSTLGITSIFCIQYTGQLDDMFKRNIDYVFCFRDNIIENQRCFFSEFGGMFSTFNEFKAAHDECIAEPWRCLVFDLKTHRKDPKQSVFWYKAESPLKRHLATTEEMKRLDRETFYGRLWAMIGL